MKPTEQLSLSSDIPADRDQLAVRPEPSISNMLQAFIDRGISAENVNAFEKLLELKERIEQRDAEKQFAAAFAALQSEMPSIEASKVVPDKYGNVKFRFAPYEQIMEQIRPLLLKYGFTVSFSMAFADNRVVQSCTLQHVGGHSRTNQFMARTGDGPPGASPAQADGAASTYAKRFALCNALNIITEIDTDGRPDARNEGEPLPPDKAIYLRELCKEVQADEAAFLKFAGAPSFDSIGSSKFDMLVTALNRKRK